MGEPQVTQEQLNEIQSLVSKLKPTVDKRKKFYREMELELDRAYTKHGKELWGRHEFYGIVTEEFDEMWDDIKKDAPQEKLLAEIIQIAAMCLRYYETGDKYRDKR